ncbi:hypothetical protein [Streptomyces chartreusis]|uniref:hypothetical protein n=1 Tax=Streptomyces chartreusis TaxID=1969 RepID=UPI0019B3D673|nr:hypothetical protein [Streptomyces chartreusis]GGX56117.1 hypothetical protein GCM10010321_86730 [Streptomyces chartreusis]
MTQPLHNTPPTTHQQHPFAHAPGRWVEERGRALRAHRVRDSTPSAERQPVLVHERTSWGWLAWTLPADGTLPEVPHQIGVLTPVPTRAQRLALRWLTRHPAHRIDIAAGSPVSLRLSTAVVGVVGLAVALYTLSRGTPAGLVLPAVLLAPMLAEYLPEWLDARAGEHVRTVEGDAACRYLQRLAVLHATLVVAAAGSDRDELWRSAEIGHHLLWDAADLLQAGDTRLVSARLIDRERLMLQLAHQVAQDLERIRAKPASGEAGQPHTAEGLLGPLPPGFEPATPPNSVPTAGTSPLKGYRSMAQAQSDDAVRTEGVYLLFAHEPYFPGDGAQEVNATVVAAASLLHPRVRQPDGARIHDRLTRGRTPGEVIPLATLTHELGGGADWPYVGDWERVTTDLVQLVRTAECDALSLGLPEIARALICTGPHNHVRTLNTAAGQALTYGPTERADVLATIDAYLACLVEEQDLWPGDGLLPPSFRQA